VQCKGVRPEQEGKGLWNGKESQCPGQAGRAECLEVLGSRKYPKQKC